MSPTLKHSDKHQWARPRRVEVQWYSTKIGRDRRWFVRRPHSRVASHAAGTVRQRTAHQLACIHEQARADPQAAGASRGIGGSLVACDSTWAAQIKLNRIQIGCRRPMASDLIMGAHFSQTWGVNIGLRELTVSAQRPASHDMGRRGPSSTCVGVGAVGDIWRISDQGLGRRICCSVPSNTGQ